MRYLPRNSAEVTIKVIAVGLLANVTACAAGPQKENQTTAATSADVILNSGGTTVAAPVPTPVSIVLKSQDNALSGKKATLTVTLKQDEHCGDDTNSVFAGTTATSGNGTLGTSAANGSSLVVSKFTVGGGPVAGAIVPSASIGGNANVAYPHCPSNYQTFALATTAAAISPGGGFGFFCPQNIGIDYSQITAVPIADAGPVPASTCDRDRSDL